MATEQEQEEELIERAMMRDLEIDTALESEFYFDPEKHRRIGERPYVLPFGRDSKKWSPYDVENAHFGKNWLRGMYALICHRTDEVRTRPSRLIFSHGSPLNELGIDLIGQEFVARHDQTNAKLGVYKIVGLVIWDSEKGDVLRTAGDVPDVKLSQNTYK